MLLFGLSMYTYGLATYFIPILLVILFIYFYRTEKVNMKDFFISLFVYIIISLPILLMYIINFFSLDTIKIGYITIPYLPEFERMSDILFCSENLLLQLIINITNFFKVIILQYDSQIWNAIPFFGTTYIFSLFFFVYALIFATKNDKFKNSGIIVMLIWILISLGIGILVKDITIYKINIIWYPIIIIISIGIYNFCEKNKYSFQKIYIVIIAVYIVFLILFLAIFNMKYRKVADDSIFWDSGLTQAIEYIEKTDYEKCIIVDYNMYRLLERPKTFIRAVTAYQVSDYNYDIIEKIDIQFTEKYRIVGITNMEKIDFENYSIGVIPNFEKIKSKLLEKDYKLTSFKNYVVFEK